MLLNLDRLTCRKGLRRMTAVAAAVAVTAGALLGPTSPAAVAAPAFGESHETPFGFDPAEVEQAIAKGVEWLYSKQGPDGSWENVPFNKRNGERPSTSGGQWGGYTSLIVYALLSAGEDPNDPRLAKAIEWLRNAQIEGVYALGMRAQVWLFLPRTPENRQAMLRDASLLGEAVQGNDPQEARKSVEQKPNRGLFDYLLGETNRVDMSVSQYGVLGLWAAQQYGVEVPSAYWGEFEQGWHRHQEAVSAEDRTAGWRYQGLQNMKYPLAVAMTTAGVATLFITQDYLRADDGIRCTGNVSDVRIDSGLKYVIEHFPAVIEQSGAQATLNNRDRQFRFYLLYGVERIGVASGLKYFGDLDWYAEGANYLIRQQGRDGNWGGEKKENTAFALLFLARGRESVMFNKLKFDKPESARARGGDEAESARTEAAWNQRPRDVANLARFVGEQIERELNWQIVDLSRGPEALHEAPVLYLAAGDELNFTDEQKQTLKDYVLQGGLIFINADCGRRNVLNSVRKLGLELFPNYELRNLETSHPIFSEQQFDVSKIRRTPRLMAIGNGAREFMVVVPNQDYGRDWQRNNRGEEEAFQVATNVYLYAVDKTRQVYKGVTHWVTPDPSVNAPRPIKVARVILGKQSDPEPAGWERLSAVMHNQDKVDLEVEPVELAKEDLSGFKLAHLTGTGTLDADAKTVKALQNFVQGGGTLVIDAAGGSTEFAESAKALLAKAFPKEAEQLEDPLPASHALYKALPESISRVDYRDFARKSLGAAREPRLRGIEINGRLAVVFSPEDLSVGLNGAPVGGIVGYSPEDATKLMRAVLLHGAK